MLSFIKKLFSFLFGEKRENYNYIIEIRPTFEKRLGHLEKSFNF